MGGRSDAISERRARTRLSNDHASRRRELSARAVPRRREGLRDIRELVLCCFLFGIGRRILNAIAVPVMPGVGLPADGDHCGSPAYRVSKDFLL